MLLNFKSIVSAYRGRAARSTRIIVRRCKSQCPRRGQDLFLRLRALRHFAQDFALRQAQGRLCGLSPQRAKIARAGDLETPAGLHLACFQPALSDSERSEGGVEGPAGRVKSESLRARHTSS